MSLSFVRSQSKTEPDVLRRSQDDIYARGPVLIANRYFNPLTDYIPLGAIIKTWRLAASCTNDLVDGRRFENATWRLWGQKQLKLKRINNADVDWETVLGWSASGKAASLLVPVVVSKETCHGTHEIPLLSAFHGILPAPTPYWLPSPGSVPMETTIIGDSSPVSIKSCVKSDTSSSRSSPLSFRNIPLPACSPTVHQPQGPRVVFNSYVEQSIILNASGEENDSGSETNVVSKLELDNDEILLKRLSRTFETLSYNKDSGEDTDEEPTSAAPMLIRPATPKPVGFVLIQSLPPIQLFPKVEDEERGVIVIFVPPKAQGTLREEDVLLAEKKPPPPTTKLQRTLSSHDLVTVIENEKAEMALGEMRGARSRSAPTLGGAKTRGGWLLLDGADSSSDEEAFMPTVMSRRRLREKRTKEVKAKARFSFGDEEEDGEEELDEDWETVGAHEERFRNGRGAAPGIVGRATNPEIQGCVQGNPYGVDGTVETSAKAVVYHGEEESKGAVVGTIDAFFHVANEEAVQATENGAGGVADADVEEVVKGLVEVGDGGVWVEQGHGEEGGEGQASQAVAVGPLAMIASWVKPAVGLGFWKK